MIMNKAKPDLHVSPAPRWERHAAFLEPMLLLLLSREPAHGYRLTEQLTELFNVAELPPQTVYRTLQTMEAAHWVTATWEIERTQAPPRKVYVLTQEGKAALGSWFTELENLRQMLDTVMEAYQQSHTLQSKGENPCR